MRVKRNCSAAWFEGVADRAHIVFETLIHDIDLLLWFSGSQAPQKPGGIPKVGALQ